MIIVNAVSPAHGPQCAVREEQRAASTSSRFDGRGPALNTPRRIDA